MVYDSEAFCQLDYTVFMVGNRSSPASSMLVCGMCESAVILSPCSIFDFL